MKTMVYRPHLSPYFSKEFVKLEQKMAEKFGLNYTSDASKLEEDCDIILLSDTHINLEQIHAKLQERLKLIIHGNSGYDNLLIKNLPPCPIILGNEIRRDAVIQTALTFLMQNTGAIPYKATWDKERAFDRKLISSMKTLIIGHGMIGSGLAKALNAMGAKVNIYDPPKDHLAALKSDYDLVILACELNPKTQGIINRDILDCFSEDYILINIARGKLVVEKDLIQSLRNRKKAFAYLDVFENEPHDFKSFSKINNIQLSSHIAGVSDQLENLQLKFETEVLTAYFELSKTDFETRYKDINLKQR